MMVEQLCAVPRRTRNSMFVTGVSETVVLIAFAVVCASVVVHGISPVPQQIAPKNTTCAFYTLAYDYASKIQPNITTAQLRAVYDALALQNCPGSPSAPNALPSSQHLASAHVRHPTKDTEKSGDSSMIFVDPVHGLDTNSGSKSSPLKSIAAAQLVARKSPPASIELRAGVHYIGATLELTPLDNGLTIESYDNEKVIISGAEAITVASWEPYNVTNGTNPTMSLLNNTNLVYGAAFNASNANFFYLGKTATYSECSNACQQNSSCIAFTWHDLSQPPSVKEWDGMCYFVNEGTPIHNVFQTHHISGIKSQTVPQNIYVAHNVDVPQGMTGLRVGGARAIRARWPNGDPEYQLFPDGWYTPAKWGSPKKFENAEDITVLNPNRSTEGPCSSSSGYCYYVTGVGGGCEHLGFEPPSGYWCSSDPPRGAEYSVAFPSSLGYDVGAFDGREWTSFKPNQTVINAFRQGHWFSYVFLVDQYNASAREMAWTIGGFQGGEGCGTAGEWNVENVFEELDSPNEWFYDDVQKDLYFFYNHSGAPPANLQFAGTKLQQLVTITGGGSARGETQPPVKDISIRGVQFSDAALTTLEPHGLPSDGGGDWAIARRAAVHVSGVEGITIEGCLFDRLDGNAVMISGYSRNTTVRDCEFHLIGENGIVSWGYTADFADAKREVPIPLTQGPDATDGNHPQGNLIESNFFHEIGHFQKQISCYFQAQSQMSVLSNNICFNMPRAGFNFNDGMGGGDTLEWNLIFNAVRETQDHGSFNSWDRQPFYYLNDDKPTYVPKYREITRNLWINDYNPQEAVDNDDGSCYYETHHNVFPLSAGGLKNDFGGHDNHHSNNFYYTSGGCMGVCAQKVGHEDAFYNNTCVIHRNSPQYSSFANGVDGPALPIMHDNRVYTLDGKTTENGKSISSWQQQGHDLGTIVGSIPADSELISIAKGILQME